MSFGYSVGDFFRVVQFAWDTFERCKNSTSALKDLGRDVGNAHIVLRNIHRFWRSEEQHDRDLLTLQQDELKQLAENCNGALEDVEKIRQKHGKLETSGSFGARVKYVVKDMIHNFGSVRQRLQQYTGNLALFHTMLTTEALHQASGDQRDILESLQQQSEILKVLVIGYHEFQEGKRAEPAYSQVARTIGQGQQEEQKQQTNEAAEEELRVEGIEKSIILEHHHLIEEWLETVILASTEDLKDDDATSVVRSSTAVEDDAGPPTLLGLNIDENPTGSQENQPCVPQNEAALVGRSSSVSTHRSQSSIWESPEADEIEDYAATMIAKVLRSKYPSASGNEIFELPIKRAFHHLDWVNRGWLPRAEVERQCLAGASKLHWNLESSVLARIVRMEDDKKSNPDHRVDLQEFTNIILTVREERLTAISIESSKNGLRNAASALNTWYASSDGKNMLSGYWSLQRRYKPKPADPRRESEVSMLTAFKHTYPRRPLLRVEYMTYTHEFSGDIPETSTPLDTNITNAVYLATRYCTPQVNMAFASWRAGLRRWAAEDRAEVIDALNNTLEVAGKFHNLEINQDHDAFHWLDRLVETASIVPLFQDMGNCPLESIISMRMSCWSLLRQIIGFVDDLWIPQRRKGSLTLPNIQVWRQLRMFDRSRAISTMASMFTEASSVLEAAQTWYSQHESLEVYGKECVKYARLLRQEQEKYASSCRTISIHGVKIGKIPSPLFRPPSTFAKIFVNGKLRKQSNTVKSSTPVWNFGYLDDLLVNGSDLVRFEFYTFPNADQRENKTQLGFIEFGVKEVADFERLAPVNVRKQLSGGSSENTRGNEVRFSVIAFKATESLSGGPSYWEEKEACKKSEVSLANYIISHPIPEGWKLQRTTNDKVYFFNLKDSKPTATLWYDPLHAIAPESKLEPLPPKWKRFSKNGEIWYTSTQHAKHSTTQTRPEPQDPMTFEHMLKPVPNHFPHEFYVDSDER